MLGASRVGEEGRGGHWGLAKPLEERQQLAKARLPLARPEETVSWEAGKWLFFLARLLLPAAGCRAKLGLIRNLVFLHSGSKVQRRRGGLPDTAPLGGAPATSTETLLPVLNPPALGKTKP